VPGDAAGELVVAQKDRAQCLGAQQRSLLVAVGVNRNEVDAIIAEGAIPSMVVVVRIDGAEALAVAAGAARREPWRPTTVDTPYDLASVTKPFAGGALAVALVEAGLLDLDAPVAEHVPGAPALVTARHLLHHAGGYPAWRPLFKLIPQTN
jgi:CubicO group peptidase (beta-lactamase class C family)